MAIDMSKSSEQRIDFAVKLAEIFEYGNGAYEYLINRMKNIALPSDVNSVKEFIELMVDAELLTKAEVEPAYIKYCEEQGISADDSSTPPKEISDPGNLDIPTPNPSEVQEG